MEDSPRHSHRSTAIPSPTAIIRKNDRKVSKRVVHICINILPSLAIDINVLRILEGELNINGLTTPVLVDISHAAIKPVRIRKRTIVTIIW